MRVLIVDDDETFCQLLAEVLQDNGMQVVWTTDGLAGYEMSSQQVYDVFIVDVRMPLILGTELAEALKKDHPRAKIILGFRLRRSEPTQTRQTHRCPAFIKTLQYDASARGSGASFGWFHQTNRFEFP